MKEYEVVAAIIVDGQYLLACQRAYGELAGGWEFPGGKLEAGESQECALIREIKEELAADIEIERFFKTITYTYDKFRVTMHCYICHLKGGFSLLEHSEYRWLGEDDIFDVDWLPADVELIENILEDKVLSSQVGLDG